MSQSASHIDLHARLSATGWHIFRTVLLGAVAAALAAYGEQKLTEARPIFPLIDQNFGLWQAAYAAAVLLTVVTWLLAMRQRIGLYQNCLHHIKMQKVIEEQRERREQREQEAREAREARRREMEELRSRPPVRGNTRSTKFDY